MKSGRKLAAALTTAAALVTCGAGTANAAVTASVTGDAGTPVPLNEAAATPIRNMDVRAYVHVDATDAKSYQWVVHDPSGTGATTLSPCWNTSSATSLDDDRLVNYRGNGTYTLYLNLYAATNCTGAATGKAYRWATGASVGIGQPAGPLMIRQPFSFTTITQNLDFAGTPGAWTYEIKYAKGATVQPDGSITAGTVQDGYLDRATGKVQIIGAREPGDYTIVARAKAGDYYTPWSPPVTFRLMAPFDLATVRFPDARGPRYQLRGEVREHAIAGGRVTVAIAKGKKGKKFRTLGKAKVNSKGIFKLRFTVRQRGSYRLRYSYRGGSAVARGTVYETITIRRVLG